MWLTDVSIRRPVFILMVVSALMVLGWRSLRDLPTELNPKVDIPYITITTVYPGTGPEEIENIITRPIEDAVASVNGLKNLNSSSQEGISYVQMELELGTDLDAAAADVRQRVEQARRLLPRDVDPPVVSKLDIGAMPILYMGMLSDKRSPRELRDLADRYIQYRLGKVPGVGSVQVAGGDVREIRVNVDKGRLSAYGLTINDVANAIQSANLNLPAGHISEGPRDYGIRLIGEFASIEEIRQLRLQFPGKGPQGRPLTLNLADLATVEDTSEERDIITRTNLRDSVGIIILKLGEANTVEVADGVKKEIAALEKELPPDIHFVITQDQSRNVKAALRDVTISLELGVLLAVLVVFLFLHNLRGTFIVSIAIPTSLIATFIPMKAFGFTLNQMTMLALSLVVGILVDDSIVVLENIYRHLQRGERPREAAYNGRSEIGLAAITITLVDVVVFIPIAFMGGIVGQFFRQFGITVACATLFSLFISFTFTPMLASRWYRVGEELEAKKGFFGFLDRLYHALDEYYRGLLSWALKGSSTSFYLLDGWLCGFTSLAMMLGGGFLIFRGVNSGALLFTLLGSALLTSGAWLGAKVAQAFRGENGRDLVHRLAVVLLGVYTLVLVSAWGLPRLGFQFVPPADQGQIITTIELPPGSSMELTNQIARKVEKILISVPEADQIFTSVGNIAGGFRNVPEIGRHYAQMSLKLKDKENLLDRLLRPFRRGQQKRTRSDQDVAIELRRKMAHIPGAKIVVAPVRGFGGAAAPIQIELLGKDLEHMARVASQIRNRISTIPGVINTDISLRVGKPEVQVRLDRVRSAELGIDLRTVAMVLRNAFEGDTNAKYRERGEQYNIRVKYRDLDKASITDVGSVVVGNRNGKPIYLRDVAHLSMGAGPTKIDRKNRFRMVLVTGYLAKGYALGNVMQEVSRRIADIPLGDIQMNFGGETQAMRENMAHLLGALGLSVVLVYMLMAALFDSLLHPFTILLSLPMALVGVILALVLAKEALSIFAMIGVIMLVGLVMKNAILLIDYTNTLRRRGYHRDQAVLEAGPTRLRPILMTTTAMILGMLPIALRIGEASEFRAGMAISVIGGLVLSTLLTLVMIPVIYTLFDDLTAKVMRRPVY